MNSRTYESKRNFICRSLSRCVAEMYPGVCKLEYHLHAQGTEEVAVIRCVNGYLRRLDVTGLDLHETTQAILRELREGAA